MHFSKVRNLLVAKTKTKINASLVKTTTKLILNHPNRTKTTDTNPFRFTKTKLTIWICSLIKLKLNYYIVWKQHWYNIIDQDLHFLLQVMREFVSGNMRMLASIHNDFAWWNHYQYTLRRNWKHSMTVFNCSLKLIKSFNTWHMKYSRRRSPWGASVTENHYVRTWG